MQSMHRPYVVRAMCVLTMCGWCVARHSSATTIVEDFSVDPAAHGWHVFGNTNFFHWNPTNQNLETTWDSSSSNSYFQLPTGTILTRSDDFSFGLDLRLDDIAGGIYSGKPGPFELAFGFQNQTD